MSNTCLKQIERIWEYKTETANKLYNIGRFQASMNVYKEALYRAEVLNNYLIDGEKNNIPILQIFVISCNNIGFTFEKMGKCEKSEKMLKRVIYYLLLQSNNKLLNSLEVQNELKRAIVNYTDFATRNNLEVNEITKVFKDIYEQLDT